MACQDWLLVRVWNRGQRVVLVESLHCFTVLVDDISLCAWLASPLPAVVPPWYMSVIHDELNVRVKTAELVSWILLLLHRHILLELLKAS